MLFRDYLKESIADTQQERMEEDSKPTNKFNIDDEVKIKPTNDNKIYKVELKQFRDEDNIWAYKVNNKWWNETSLIPAKEVKERFEKEVLGVEKEEKREEVEESALPPGFSKNDIQTTDEFIKSEKNVKDVKKDIDESKEEKDDNELEKVDEEKYVSYTFEESIDEAVDDAETSDIDIDKLKKTQLDKRAGGKDPEAGVEVAKKQAKMLHASNIIDADGNPIDNDVLMAKMTVRPKALIGQNSKLGKSGDKQTFYDLTLPAYQGLYVDEKTKTFKVIKTCPSAGECSKFCYASKGGYIMFAPSGLNASRVVTYMMNHYDEFKAQLESELKTAVSKEGKKGNKVVLRWHDSGDFISPSYLKMAFDIAKETPEVLHYAYTKQIPLVKSMEADKPDNFEFTYSFGGVHDEKIDTTKERHARVVPAAIFKDLPFKKGPGVTSFLLSAGNDTWGGWKQILGSSDTPVMVSGAYFDFHNIGVEAANFTGTYFIQISYGESADLSTKLTTHDYTALIYMAQTNQIKTSLTEIRFKRQPSGTKIWARIMVPGENAKTLSMYFGYHEYLADSTDEIALSGALAVVDTKIQSVIDDGAKEATLSATFTNDMPELSADPGATPTIKEAITLLYSQLRNAETVTSTERTIKNDAGATILTQALSDDGTTFTKEKVVGV